MKPPVSTPKAASAGLGKARALYNFSAQRDGDLSFNLGDEIIVLEKDDKGWWKGEVNGKTGVFPSNYVEELDG